MSLACHNKHEKNLWITHDGFYVNSTSYLRVMPGGVSILQVCMPIANITQRHSSCSYILLQDCWQQFQKLHNISALFHSFMSLWTLVSLAFASCIQRNCCHTQTSHVTPSIHYRFLSHTLYWPLLGGTSVSLSLQTSLCKKGISFTTKRLSGASEK